MGGGLLSSGYLICSTRMSQGKQENLLSYWYQGRGSNLGRLFVKGKRIRLRERIRASQVQPWHDLSARLEKGPYFGTCTSAGLLGVRGGHTVWSTLTGYFEGGEVAQVLAIDTTTTENVDDIVNDGGCVAFARRGNKADALELCPLAGGETEGPSVVVVILAVCSAKARGLLACLNGGTVETYTMIWSLKVRHTWPVRCAGRSALAGSKSSQE